MAFTPRPWKVSAMLTFLLSAAIFAACMRLGWILMDKLDGR
jgi:hypothetical protein